MRGFDIALVPKPKMFGGGKRPRLLGRFVAARRRRGRGRGLDAAVKGMPRPSDEVCVFLLGSSRGAGAGAGGGDRRAAAQEPRGAKVTLIPIDVRDWDAHMPVDAPGGRARTC